MISLFRKIRQKLLAENRVTRYVIYAVGEILLVVIGILIALQVNNWNENRKLNIRQVEILESLHSDISNNIKNLKSVISHDSSAHFMTLHILNLMQDPNARYHDSLQVYFGVAGRFDVFQPRRMAYEVFKSTGLEVIHNPALRSEIIQLYDEIYSLNPWILEVRKDIHMLSVTLFNKRFLTQGRASHRIPNDFEALKSDSEYINHLSYVAAEDANILGHYRLVLQFTESTLKSIENELADLTKK